MSETVIKIEHLTKKYKLYNSPRDRFKETFSFSNKRYSRDFYALDDISFSISKGETVGIVGKNGSGKSTLLKILTGVLSQSSGISEVNGKVSALLELGAGFNVEFTGIDNIYLNGTIMNISKEEMDKKLDDIIAFADIGEFIYQPVKTYSSGMFVRLAFAVAINVDPQILIVDEALAVGDTRFQVKCMDKFIEFMNAGKTVIFVSHDVNMIKRFCKRAIWLNEGSLIADGETDLITDGYADFLKSGLSYEEYEKLISLDDRDMERSQPSHGRGENTMAEVHSLRIFDKNGQDTSEIVHGEDVTIEIAYEVIDEKIDKPVLGVAIRSIDHQYICGLNTLLDGKDISWKKGMNTCRLTYEKFNLIGGNYYFEVALYDQTATVPFDYKGQFKNFFVKMNYIAEGTVVLHHKWS
ncbi:MAG: ABC transporter ATP-binding protein [Clostridiales bacterium]|nr:ABC transporter ATP-binding protein [Clostridiales bacterium]